MRRKSGVEGQSLFEYALFLFLVAIVVIVIMLLVTPIIDNSINSPVPVSNFIKTTEEVPCTQSADYELSSICLK
ncbi:MAG TPA: hypothetical protein VH186_29480 [Chloroflexia bacterium]|nr:hypothetical protein [Chloroflexia bacterium]